MKYTKEKLVPVIAKSKSWAEVIRNLGLKQTGGSQSHLISLAKKMEINTEHFTGQCWNRGVKIGYKNPIEDYLVLDGIKIKSVDLKKRLVAEGILKYECLWCGLGETWNEKPIVLHIDHINGNNRDNRLINLRILCPNCHSQTETYSGKSCGKYTRNKTEIGEIG